MRKIKSYVKSHRQSEVTLRPAVLKSDYRQSENLELESGANVRVGRSSYDGSLEFRCGWT